MKAPSKRYLKDLSRKWYSRDDVAEFIYEYICKHCRESMGFDVDGRVSRPLYVYHPEDVIDYAGVIASYHASIDRYEVYPGLVRDLPPSVGWDLIIDIDCKPLQLSDAKLEAWELAKHLTTEFIRFLVYTFYEDNVYVKYSGNRGFHIIIPWESLPREVLGYSLLDYKEELYKTVLIFVRDLIECIYHDLLKSYYEPISKYPFHEYVDVDLHVASPRHMIRVPYSINEKTGLVSVIIPNDDLDDFVPEENATIDIDKVYFPKIKNQENLYMYDFFIYALLYRLYHFIAASEDQRSRYVGLLYNSFKNGVDVPIENEEDLYPPCIRNILEGLEDGRKRSLFVLVNFFRLIGKSPSETMNILQEWNKRNAEPLRDRLLEYAVQYHYDRSKYLPYSCQRMREELGDIGVCKPDEVCSLVKNPVSYFFRKKALYYKSIKNNNIKAETSKQ